MKYFPELRFKDDNGNDFPEWKAGKLSELIDKNRKIRYGVVQPGKFDDRGRFLIRGKDYSLGWDKPESFFKVSETVENKYKKARVKEGDVLLTIVGVGVGNNILVPDWLDGANITQTTARIATNEDNLHNKYLIYFFQSQAGRIMINKNIRVGTRPGLNIEDVEKFDITIPKLEEQQKIASFLTSVDDKINLLTKKKKLLEKYKKGIIQKIFSQEIRFKDDNGNDFPEWKTYKLGDLGKFFSGTGFKEKEQGGKRGVPFLKVSDFNLEGNETIITNANNYVNDEQILNNKYNIIQGPSIIFAKVGAAIYLERKRIANSFLIDNNLMAFSPIGNEFFFKYLFDTLKLSRYANVGVLPAFNPSNLESIEVTTPIKEEQQKIVNFLSSLDKKNELVNSQIDKTKEFKKGLLQQMFV